MPLRRARNHAFWIDRERGGTQPTRSGRGEARNGSEASRVEESRGEERKREENPVFAAPRPASREWAGGACLLVIVHSHIQMFVHVRLASARIYRREGAGGGSLAI